MSPSITAIIATYNRADLLPGAMTSVLNQTFSDWELIVVDDGSTDDTRRVFSRLCTGRTRYVYQSNSGTVASPYNTGAREARAPFVAFLDSDDRWHSNKLERVFQVLVEEPADILCHDVVRIVGGRSAGVWHGGPGDGDMFRRLLLNGNCLFRSAVTVRRDLFLEAGGFNPRHDFHLVDDYDLWMRLARGGKRFRFLSELLGEYRIHGKNESGIFGSGDPERFYRNLRNVLRSNAARCSSLSFAETLAHLRNISTTYFSCARILHGRGAVGKAFTHYVCSFLRYPIALRRFARLLLPCPTRTVP